MAPGWTHNPTVTASIGAAGAIIAAVATGLVTYANTDSSPPKERPLSEIVSMDSPAPGTTVSARDAEDGISVGGRLSGKLPSGVLWVANKIHVDGQPNDFGSGAVAFTPLPCAISARADSWSCGRVFIGSPANAGAAFDVWVVLAPPNAVAAIIENRVVQNGRNMLPPPGAEAVQSMILVRAKA